MEDESNKSISKNEFYLVQKNVSDRIENVKQTNELVHKEINGKLDTIIVQTTKHNGRLTKVERMIWLASGAIVILGWLYGSNFLHCFTNICNEPIQTATNTLK